MHRRIIDFIHTISPHKGTLFGITFLVALFSIVPFDVVQAGLSEIIGGAIKFAVNPVLNLIFGVFAGIFFGIFTALAGAMNAVISLFLFMPIAPGNPGTPVFVQNAWGTSRDLVNIIFILILVFIGLATILRVQSY